MKLFGYNIGKGSTEAKVLPPLLASLLGGEEGKELVVDATAEGVAAIAAAEQSLEEFNQQATDQQAAIEAAEKKAKDLEADLETEKAAHAKVASELEDLKAETSAEHTGRKGKADTTAATDEDADQEDDQDLSATEKAQLKSTQTFLDLKAQMEHFSKGAQQ